MKGDEAMKRRRLQPSTPTWKNCLLFYFSRVENILPGKSKGRCKHFGSVATHGLCVWSSWEPISGICSLLEISIACALPYHLSLDFFHCHRNRRSWLGGEGELLLCQEPGIREIRKLSYMLDLSKHWLGKCCLTTWRCCLLKKIMMCPGMSQVPVLQRVGTGWLQVFPINPQWMCKSASIPFKGYRDKNKYTL